MGEPSWLTGATSVFGIVFYPTYRLFIVLAAVVVGLCLWVLLERTRLGGLVRACVDDEEMARGMGVNVSRLYAGVFAFSSLLAGLAGGLEHHSSGRIRERSSTCFSTRWSLSCSGVGEYRGCCGRKRGRGHPRFSGQESFPGPVLFHALRADDPDPPPQTDGPLGPGLKSCGRLLCREEG